MTLFTVKAGVLLIASVVMSSAFANAPADFSGTSCKLEAPPSDSGEEAMHSNKLLIYPRASQINRSFTGCQSMWYQDTDKWLLVSKTHVVKGEAVAIWSADRSGGVVCRYEKGKALGDKTGKCPDYRLVIAKSLPLGCFAKIKASGQFPKECDYD
ncbi:hypothetical protein [Variovorax sp. PCZ-1]|uniref:hypothetical protein n=1 Tax=Variovorax sp. PCZ-1 TaxID=2835533 RepID=UPI001BCB61E5|nr:hypothetical protein [Variovorax sp. PCZ-1]MBS7807183.1 hypothetical protein [Variovorax sp. PCZ-1]